MPSSGTISGYERDEGKGAGPVTAADWQAIAEWVLAAAVLVGVARWIWNRTWPLGVRFAGRVRSAVRSVLRSEVTAGAAWASVSETPEVSMEAGIAFARTAARSGHPPYTPTSGRADPEQPLGYLLAKTAETVWEAASAGHSELEPYIVPVRNYMMALGAKAGIAQARDFALGVLTERVRQEEDGWPDHPGDHSGLRKGHGTGASHLCLLERKHEVEDAIYATETLRRPELDGYSDDPLS
jgi:hypothetical protein